MTRSGGLSKFNRKANDKMLKEAWKKKTLDKFIYLDPKYDI